MEQVYMQKILSLDSYSFHKNMFFFIKLQPNAIILPVAGPYMYTNPVQTACMSI